MYEKITSIDNLLIAWEEFIVNKKKRVDVQIFSNDLLANILSLHNDLINLTYKHSCYQRFNINDPKTRIIHKAKVRDRLLHHAIYRVLCPIFDKSFIYDSYSCRLNKGTHKAVKRLESFTQKVSRNYTKPCYILKCDVKKFFDSVDHKILLRILKKKIIDPDVIWLLKEIIRSFDSSHLRSNNKQMSLFEDYLALPQDDKCKSRERERESGGALRAWDTDRQSYQPAFCQCLSQRARPIY